MNRPLAVALLSSFILLQCCCFTLALVLGRGGSKQEDFLVKSLPGLFENVPKHEIPTVFSGQLELFSENNTYYYFQKYVDPHKVEAAKGKTIFWLNGGPGCLSMDGALMEAGPFRINSEGKVVYNNGSWHKAADVVFVDQPAGTGFSYSSAYDHNLVAVAHHFLRFMDKFFELFPEDRDNDIFLAGESYAGQYIPYIATRINRFNELEVPFSKEKSLYNLKGLLIGNGWIDPQEQSLAYLPYSIQAGVVTKDTDGFQDLLKQHEECQKLVNTIAAGDVDPKNVNNLLNSKCEKILNLILYLSMKNDGPDDQRCVNMYDYTLRDSYPSCGMNWPPDLEYVNPFLNNDQIMDSLNVKAARKWRECSGRVGRNLHNDGIPPSIVLLPEILKRMPVLLFHGNRDIICNYMGAESMIKKLEWGGKTGYLDDSTVYQWKYNNELSGYVQTERNLTYVNVFDSSHMVAFDKSAVSRSVIDLLLKRYDEKIEGDKKVLETYPVGHWKLTEVNKPEDVGKIPSSTVSASGFISGTASATSGVHLASATSDDSDSDSETDTDTDTDSEEEKVKDGSTLNKVIRLIQLAVICILLWGVSVLYKTYRSKPSSIIKSGPSSGRKKNVQWADQLRDLQGSVGGALDKSDKGFLSKAYDKITGKDGYQPTATEDIEMGDAVGPSPEHFEIGSDEEEGDQQDVDSGMISSAKDESDSTKISS